MIGDACLVSLRKGLKAISGKFFAIRANSMDSLAVSQLRSLSCGSTVVRIVDAAQVPEAGLAEVSVGAERETGAGELVGPRRRADGDGESDRIFFGCLFLCTTIDTQF